MVIENNFFEKFFFEQTFNPIALYYKIEPDIGIRGSSAIIYIDVNSAYERVNNVKREEVAGKSFLEVWPNVEPCWSEIIKR
ncbi:MAG: hypothetical protein LUE09_07250 [Synergistaceae bacterium]|nr:hypothetical protein [Synergistaceae bacterium]